MPTVRRRPRTTSTSGRRAESVLTADPRGGRIARLPSPRRPRPPRRPGVRRRMTRTVRLSWRSLAASPPQEHGRGERASPLPGNERSRGAIRAGLPRWLWSLRFPARRRGWRPARVSAPGVVSPSLRGRPQDVPRRPVQDPVATETPGCDGLAPVRIPTRRVSPRVTPAFPPSSECRHETGPI